MEKNTKIGLALIITPFVLLILSIVGYATVNFIITSTVSSVPPVTEQETVVDQDPQSTQVVESEDTDTSGALQFAEPQTVQEESSAVTAGRIANIILGLVGMLSLVGIVVGIPVGIYFLAKGSKEAEGIKMQDKR